MKLVLVKSIRGHGEMDDVFINTETVANLKAGPPGTVRIQFTRSHLSSIDTPGTLQEIHRLLSGTDARVEEMRQIVIDAREEARRYIGSPGINADLQEAKADACDVILARFDIRDVQ